MLGTAGYWAVSGEVKPLPLQAGGRVRDTQGDSAVLSQQGLRGKCRVLWEVWKGFDLGEGCQGRFPERRES